MLNATTTTKVRCAPIQRTFVTCIGVAIAFSLLVSPAVTDSARAQSSGCTTSSYTVRPGDTIDDIARRSNTSKTRIMDCNSLNTNVVRAGDQLNLPSAVRTPTGADTRINRVDPRVPTPVARPSSRSSNVVTYERSAPVRRPIPTRRPTPAPISRR